MRKIFEVKVYDKMYPVYELNRRHEGMNGVPDSWWLYYSGEIPDNISEEDVNFLPLDYSLYKQRLSWEIKFSDYATSKEKWNEMRFNTGTSCEMICNNKVVYKFTCGNMDFAFAKARYLMTILVEHPFDFINPENMKGHKIWFHGLPATVQPSFIGKIDIWPDYTTVDKKTWWDEYRKRTIDFKFNKVYEEGLDTQLREMEVDDYDEIYGSDHFRWGDPLSDGDINWSR